MAGYYQTKVIALVFLLSFVGLSKGQVLDVAEDMNHAILPREANARMKTRKLVDIVGFLDYEKEHANRRNEPPKH